MGAKGIEVGIGCGVGFGHGFGIGTTSIIPSEQAINSVFSMALTLKS